MKKVANWRLYCSSAQSNFSQPRQRTRRNVLPLRLSRTAIGQAVPPQRAQLCPLGGGGGGCRASPVPTSSVKMTHLDRASLPGRYVPWHTQGFRPKADRNQKGPLQKSKGAINGNGVERGQYQIIGTCRIRPLAGSN